MLVDSHAVFNLIAYIEKKTKKTKNKTRKFLHTEVENEHITLNLLINLKKSRWKF